MTWVAVAVAGAGVIGAGAAYAGSKKQGDAAKDASNLQMQQFQLINQQQQPFIRSGYGSMGRLNTLLGINSGPRQQYGMQPPGYGYMPTPAGGMTRQIPMPQGQMGVPQGAPNFNLSRVLAMRAAHGDTEAQRMLGTLQ